jgi:hypothetical protein
MANDYRGMTLCLSPTAIFIQLDRVGDPDPRSVVFDHHSREHFTPQNESALGILDLLTRDRGEVISFDTLKQHLLNQYELTDSEAITELNEFLTILDEKNLLGKPRGRSNIITAIPQAATTKRPRAEARCHIQGGATLIVCGYVVTRYRP